VSRNLGSLARVVGTTLIVLALLVAGFLAYSLWLTGVSERASQRALVSQIEGALPHTLGRAAETPAPLPTGPTSPATDIVRAHPGEWLGVIEIPRIDVNDVVVEGTGHAQLATGPGHYIGSAPLGSMGNSAIAGHRTTYGAPFAHLDALRAGDAIVVTTSRASYLYRVRRVLVVPPTGTWVLRPTLVASLTLTTCTPPLSASSRLVVLATMTATTRFARPTILHGTLGQSAAVLLVGGDGGWWPVFLYATLLTLAISLGLRWFRRSRRPTIVAIVMVMISAPLIFELYSALAWQMPATL